MLLRALAQLAQGAHLLGALLLGDEDRQPLRVGSGPRERDLEHRAVHEHHDAKTHGLWRLSYHPDTAIKTWTSPLARATPSAPTRS